MIKNIYDKTNKCYIHDYYCDNCFKKIVFGDILRNELAIQAEKFDLCSSCKKEGDKKQEKGGEFK